MISTQVFVIGLEVRVALPRPDFSVGRAGIDEVSRYGERGYVGVVALQSGEAVVIGGLIFLVVGL